MRLSDFLSLNKKGSTGSETGRTADASKTALINRQIRALTPGQTIQGAIVGKNGSEVQIRLSEDLVLNARLEQNMNLEMGKGMTFEVKNNGAALMLSPLFANTATDATVLKALDAAALPVNQLTVSMTGSLMEAGLSVDKAALQQVFREINAHPQASQEDIIGLHRLGIAVNEENLTQMESYRNLTHQLTAGMNDVVEELSGVLRGLTDGGRTDQAVRLGLELLSLAMDPVETGAGGPGTGQLTGETAAPGTDITAAAGQTAVPVGQDFENTLSAGGPGMVSEGTSPGGGSVSAGTAAAVGNAAPEGIPGNAVPEGMKGNTGGINVVAGDGAEPARGPENDGQAFAGGPGGGPASAAEANGRNAPFVSGKPFGEALTSELGRLLERLELPEGEYRQFQEGLEAMRNGGLSGGEALRLTGELLRRAAAEPGAERQLSAILGDRDFGRLLSRGLLDNWTLRPDEAADGGKINELYNRLSRQLRSLSQALENAGQTGGAYKAAVNLSRNLDFLQQLNQVYTYIQLPLKMRERTAHGELYVYTNKKNLAACAGSVSALLHLDMEHLGPVDVYVALQNTKVSTRFYVEDDKKLDFLAAHMDELNRRLEQRGYQMSCEMQVRSPGESAAPAFSSLLRENNAGSPLAQYAFDVRA